MAQIKLSELNPVPYNPRNITEQNLENLKTSIKVHTRAIPESDRGSGFRLASTITVNKQGNRILGGHQRIRALRLLGQDWIDERDISWVDLPPNSAEEKALNYSLNDKDSQGEFDNGLVSKMMEEIKKDNSELFGELKFSDDLMKQISKESTGGKNLSLDPKDPDKVWVLIGCPLDKYGDLSDIIAKLEEKKPEGTVIVKSKKKI